MFSVDSYDREDIVFGYDVLLCDRNSFIPQTIQLTRIDYK